MDPTNNDWKLHYRAKFCAHCGSIDLSNVRQTTSLLQVVARCMLELARLCWYGGPATGGLEVLLYTTSAHSNRALGRTYMGVMS